MYMCERCQDSGIVLSYWPRSVDDAPEYDRCTCYAGQRARLSSAHTTRTGRFPPLPGENCPRCGSALDLSGQEPRCDLCQYIAKVDAI